MFAYPFARATRSAALLTLGLSAAHASAQTSPNFVVDLSLHETGGKEITVHELGETVVMDLYVSVFGLDGNPANDGMQNMSGGFRSSDGGLIGDLLTLSPVAPFNASGAVGGAQHDLDGDGDLDIGEDPSIDEQEPWFRARSGSPVYRTPPGGFHVGQVMFTVTSFDGGSTAVNYVPRTDAGPAGLFYASVFPLDGKMTSFNSTDPRFSLGTPVIIHGDPIVDTETQYISGAIDSHLTVTQRLRPQPGGPALVIARGIDVTSTGDFDTMQGPDINIRDTTSGNAGGTLRSNGLIIGAAGGATFANMDGFTRVGTLVVGDATNSNGTLNVSGGSLLAAYAEVGGVDGGNGTVRQTGGTVAITDMGIGNGSGQGTYELVNGTMSVSNQTRISDGGSGEFRQSGGISNFGGRLTVGGRTYMNSGVVKLSGGTLNAARIDVAPLGAGTIEQTGGELRTSYLFLSHHDTGPGLPAARYVLSNGKLFVNALSIGAGGNGVFVQNGGEVVVGANLFAAGDPGPGRNARYELHGGTLRSAKVHVAYPLGGPSGEFIQDGGVHIADQVKIYPGGVYRHTGGAFIVKNQLTNEGTLDFGNTAVTLNADRGAFVNLANGTLAGAGSANFVGEPGSLFSFPAGFDPQTQLGSFTTQGLLHQAGQPLSIPEGFSVSGSGTIEGTVTNAGAVSPGNSPGVLGVDGNYTQTGTGSLHVEIEGTEAELFDTLTIAGSASLAGTLDVALLGTFIPDADDQFTILTATSLSGGFTNAPNEIAFAGGIFDVLYGPTSVTLANFQAAPIPEPSSLVLLALAPMLMRRRRSDACAA